MKNFTLLLFLLIALGLFSQTQIYYGKDGKDLKSAKKAIGYKVISVDSTSDGGSFEQKYTIDDRLLQESYYFEKINESTNRKMTLRYGKFRSWYDNGRLKNEIDFKNNKCDGSLISYWRNGQLKRKDIFENGKFIEGACYDSLGNNVEHYSHEKMPMFPGGDKALFVYLSETVRYPVEAQKKGVHGRVITQFVVDVDGKITNVQVIRGISPELDAEARRVVRGMPRWEPGVQYDNKVRVNYTLPINFKFR